MKNKSLRSGFFARHRIEIVMWALVAEMLASPLADSHPRVGALLGFAVLLMVLAGIGHFANRLVVRRVVLPVAGIWMITRIVEAFGNPHEPYANLSPVVGLAFSCSILWAIFDHFHSDFRKSAECDRRSVHQLPGNRNGIFAALLDPESFRRPRVQSDDSVHAGWNVSLFQHGYADQRRLWRDCAAEPLRADRCRAGKYVRHLLRRGCGRASGLELQAEGGTAASFAG